MDSLLPTATASLSGDSNRECDIRYRPSCSPTGPSGRFRAMTPPKPNISTAAKGRTGSDVHLTFGAECVWGAGGLSKKVRENLRIVTQNTPRNVHYIGRERAELRGEHSCKSLREQKMPRFAAAAATGRAAGRAGASCRPGRGREAGGNRRRGPEGQRAELGLRIAECGLRIGECGLGNADCGMWIADCRATAELFAEASGPLRRRRGAAEGECHTPRGCTHSTALRRYLHNSMLRVAEPGKSPRFPCPMHTNWTQTRALAGARSQEPVARSREPRAGGWFGGDVERCPSHGSLSQWK